MDHFIDQAARLLASEMPRRQALLRLGGLIVGGVLATLKVDVVMAQTVVCPKGKILCTTATPPFCVAAGTTCCGKTSCKSGQKCCNGVGASSCVKSTDTCCGATACPSGQTCCPGNGFPFCRTKKQTCCGSKACNPGQVCCSGTLTCCKQCNQVGQCTGSPS